MSISKRFACGDVLESSGQSQKARGQFSQVSAEDDAAAPLLDDEVMKDAATVHEQGELDGLEDGELEDAKRLKSLAKATAKGAPVVTYVGSGAELDMGKLLSSSAADLGPPTAACFLLVCDSASPHACPLCLVCH